MKSKRHRPPRLAVPQFAFIPCLFWMLLAVAGADLLLAEESAPEVVNAESRATRSVLSYFAPRLSSLPSTSETVEAVQPPTSCDCDPAPGSSIASLWNGPGMDVFCDQMQTIRWDPEFPQPAPSPSIFGQLLPTSPPLDARTPADLQTVSHETLPPPTPVTPAAPGGLTGLLAPSDSSMPTSFNPYQTFNFWATNNVWVQIDGLFRGYYHNDQRIEWSGVEATFGAEGILRPLVYVREGEFQVSGEAEFFLNQPFGNSLFSSPLTQPFRANFDVNTFEIFQMYVQSQWRDFYVRVGKSRTPFGRYYAPLFTNSLQDAPFIRSQIIDWTETGVFLRYNPGWFCFDLAATNGEPNLDTNSSKALLWRLGLNLLPNWVLGFSGKTQDGISSEEQKRFHSYYGMDFCWTLGRFLLYGELLYDQHGFKRDFFNLTADPNNLGARSLYGQDVFNGGTPISGTGYYLAAGYRADRYLLDFSYGDYFPQQIGNPAHDQPVHRCVAKMQYWLTRNVQTFAVGLLENSRPFVPPLTPGTWAVFTGCQFTF